MWNSMTLILKQQQQEQVIAPLVDLTFLFIQEGSVSCATSKKATNG